MAQQIGCLTACWKGCPIDFEIAASKCQELCDVLRGMSIEYHPLCRLSRMVLRNGASIAVKSNPGHLGI